MKLPILSVVCIACILFSTNLCLAKMPLADVVEIWIETPEDVPGHFDDAWTVQVYDTEGNQMLFSEEGVFGAGESDILVSRGSFPHPVFDLPAGQYTFRLMSGSRDTAMIQPVYFADASFWIDEGFASVDLSLLADAISRGAGLSQVYVCDPEEGIVEGKIFGEELAGGEIRLTGDGGEGGQAAPINRFGDFEFVDAEVVDGLATIQFGLDPTWWEIPEFGMTVPGGWYLPKAIYVDASATGANVGMFWSDAYTDFEDALDHWISAHWKFEIWVADGVYPISNTVVNKFRPTMQIYGGFSGNESDKMQANSFLNKSILTGDIGGDDQTFGTGTVFDPDNQIRNTNTGRLFDLTNTKCDKYSILSGLTVASFTGSAMALGSSSDLTLLYCDFVGNRTYGGAAIELNFHNRAIFDSVSFRHNRATEGGAIRIGSFGGYWSAGKIGVIDLDRCYFEDNQADLGGCIFLGGQPQVNRIFISNCTFVENRAEEGGVMNLTHSPGDDESTTVFWGGCLFNGNRANASGGVLTVHLHDTNGTRVESRFMNCTFANNRANYAAMVFARAHGTAQSARVLEIDFYSCLCWAGSSASTSEIFAYGSDTRVLLTDSVLQTPFSGSSIMLRDSATSNLSNWTSSDPKFVDIDGADGFAGNADDNLRLGSGSSAISFGNNNYNVTHEFPGFLFDIDWKPRVVGPSIDAGAYEKQ